MEKQQEIYFEALTKNRTASADALDGFALRGVRKGVVEKYSDQAHFIYELIQNADDAGATSARFELFEDKLIFTHNGTRRFSVSNPETEEQDLKNGKLGDINAIAAVGGSNKNDKATIGKFGFGFKAVFQYTSTPYIYDPDIFFRIERLIVPIRLEHDYAGRRNGETLFVFPFDRPEYAYPDIFRKLRSLDFPLLFLPNLKEIRFEILGRPGLYSKETIEEYKFDGTMAKLIKLTHDNGDDQGSPSYDFLWLFSRVDPHGYKYSVGFFIDENRRLIPYKHTAFCFFPTKEVTGLNFIIHAPFLLTESREGIRAGIRHNTDMISLLADLAADSLVYLKEIGMAHNIQMIDDNIFDIIPYDESNFAEMDSGDVISFKPFYISIKRAFESKEIIPGHGGYAASDNAYWAFVPQIAELFSNEQLAMLVNNKMARWVFTSFGRQETLRKNKALKDYIDSITALWIEEKDIFEGRSLEDGSSYDGITAEFIESQPIEWLHCLYKWIVETKNRTELAKTKPIFLDRHGKAVAAFDDNYQAILFLPTEGDSVYTTINEALLQNEDTAAFIRQQLGIGEPSLLDEIYNIILPQYDNGGPIDTLPHFRKIFRYYQKCPIAEVRSFIDLIREYDFLLYKYPVDGKQYRGKAEELYFPFEPLQTWFQGKTDTKFVCFDEYLGLVGQDKKEELVSFLTELGVKDLPRVCTRSITDEEEADRIWPHYSWPQPAWYNRHTRKWTERFIDGCKENIDRIVREHDISLSIFLWNQLLKFVDHGFLKDYWWSGESVVYGHYEYFYHSNQSKPFISSDVLQLRSKPWLLNSAGEFVSANKLTVRALYKNYDISADGAAELIKILEIKEDDGEEEKTDVSSYAEALGFLEEEAKQILREAYERKKAAESRTSNKNENAKDTSPEEDVSEIDTSNIRPSVKSVVNEITKRVKSAPKEEQIPEYEETHPADEDEYSKPAVDISKRIDEVMKQAEMEIKEIARLEELKKQAKGCGKYSYGWFKALLELEVLNGSDNIHSHEISISFSRAELEQGTSRTLILKHPNRYIPQSMEDLADIPLELHFADRPVVKVAVEVVSVKSYTLRAKLRPNAHIDGIDFSSVTEARIEAKNPIFLTEELHKAFIKLGDEREFEDDYNLQSNLCENIEFVFGPPGTGKTTCLARDIILPKMQDSTDLKVLVLTPTNKAADVLVRRIMDIMGTDHSYLDWLVRFGATNDSIVEQSGVFRDKTTDIRKFSRHVTVTTIARFPYDYFLLDDGSRLHINELKWDYIIIDEASMIPLANIAYVLYKKTPKKFIISGDPFQIEPIAAVDEWKDENIYTMIELKSFSKPTTIPHQYNVTLLTTQYRSVPEIGEVFSRFAYDGILKHHRSADSQRLLPVSDFFDIKTLNIIKFPVSRYESIYRPKRLQNKTPYQVYSALFAVEFVKYISSLLESANGDEQFTIGLIAPYRAQSDLVDKLMSSVALPGNVDVQVGTIHGFQGDECDIVIALFNPPPAITTHKEMFLNKLNIINVSISRARDYLFILMPDDRTENVDNLILVKNVENLCKSQSSWIELQSTDIEEIMFGSKNYLEENSFTTTHQVVNVYGKPDKRYEIRSEDHAVDVQIHNFNERD